MVYTPRRFGVVAMLAKERLSVRGHAGLVLNPTLSGRVAS